MEEFYKLSRLPVIFIWIASICSVLFSLTAAFHDKYDIRQAPFDVQIIKDYVGYWQLKEVKGLPRRAYHPPDVIDIGLHPIPKFGSRALNATFHWFDKPGAAPYRTDYGYIPVKNATRFDPRWHTALLTTSSDGYSLLEQGLVLKGPKLRLHLKQYVRRSFNVGGDNENLRLDSVGLGLAFCKVSSHKVERLFELTDKRHMRMTIQVSSNWGNDDYTAYYTKVMPR